MHKDTKWLLDVIERVCQDPTKDNDERLLIIERAADELRVGL